MKDIAKMVSTCLPTFLKWCLKEFMYVKGRSKHDFYECVQGKVNHARNELWMVISPFISGSVG